MKELPQSYYLIRKFKKIVTDNEEMEIVKKRINGAGRCAEDDEVIINPDLTIEQQIITLFHEMIHLKYPVTTLSIEGENYTEEKAQDMFFHLSDGQYEYFSRILGQQGVL